jgi:hypothetical protein
MDSIVFIATEEAAEHFKGWQESKVAIRRAMAANKPPPYTHIRVSFVFSI